MKKKVFISYSRNDKLMAWPFVEFINTGLGKKCCWIDTKRIESGTEFENVIIHVIEDSQVVLFMLSNSSLNSELTKREMYYAENEGKRIVPIFIDGKGLRGWFKFHFGNVDFIDIRFQEQQDKFVDNLKS